jgi:hypothetical protein
MRQCRNLRNARIDAVRARRKDRQQLKVHLVAPWTTLHGQEWRSMWVFRRQAHARRGLQAEPRAGAGRASITLLLPCAHAVEIRSTGATPRHHVAIVGSVRLNPQSRDSQMAFVPFGLWHFPELKPDCALPAKCGLRGIGEREMHTFITTTVPSGM